MKKLLLPWSFIIEERDGYTDVIIKDASGYEILTWDGCESILDVEFLAKNICQAINTKDTLMIALKECVQALSPPNNPEEGDALFSAKSALGLFATEK